MSNILNTVAEYYGRFNPSKPNEYLALQIAWKLNDSSAFRHYLVLFEHYPKELILKAYHRCASEAAHFSGIVKLVRKPFHPEQLLQMVDHAGSIDVSFCSIYTGLV